MKKRILHTLIAVAVVIGSASCGNGGTSPAAGGSEELDSLKQTAVAQKRELDQLNGLIADIASGLDSIAMTENVLYANRSTDGRPLDRQQILSNLNSMAQILARQRARMSQLQDSLSKQKTQASDGIAKLQHVVEFLNRQLAEKDNVIQSLRADVQSKRKDITQLQASLSDMRSRAEKAEKREVILKDALHTQDEVINECYVRVGTKKELSAAGLLKGGFLKKKRVDFQAVDKKKFTAVDIRKFREVRLNSDNPRILTPMPSNRSFHFEDNGDGTCVLVISNPTLFWSVSNFLIIQL